jgi:hypothetical protein
MSHAVRPSYLRDVFKVYYIPVGRGDDGSFNFLYSASERPRQSDFKPLTITINEVLDSHRSIHDVLRLRLEKELAGVRDFKRYAVCPARFKVEGEELL